MTKRPADQKYLVTLGKKLLKVNVQSEKKTRYLLCSFKHSLTSKYNSHLKRLTVGNPCGIASFYCRIANKTKFFPKPTSSWCILLARDSKVSSQRKTLQLKPTLTSTTAAQSWQSSCEHLSSQHQTNMHSLQIIKYIDNLLKVKYCCVLLILIE